MKKTLFLLPLVLLLLAGCAKLPEAQWDTIKEVTNCRTESGLEVCDVTLSGGKQGKAEKYFLREGEPIRTDMVH